MTLVAVAVAAASVALGAAQVDAWVNGISGARRGTVVLALAGLATAAVVFRAAGGSIGFAAAPVALLAFACTYVAGAARVVRRVDAAR
jgi:hypothetical protein